MVDVPVLSDQQVFGIAVGACELVHDVAYIGAEPEITGAPDINRNTHRSGRSARGAAAPCQRRFNVPAAGIERKLRRELRDLGPDAALALGVTQVREDVCNPQCDAFHVGFAHASRSDGRSPQPDSAVAVIGGVVGRTGIEFLLTVMPARSSAGCASLPVTPREYRSIKKR